MHMIQGIHKDRMHLHLYISNSGHRRMLTGKIPTPSPILFVAPLIGSGSESTGMSGGYAEISSKNTDGISEFGLWVVIDFAIHPAVAVALTFILTMHGEQDPQGARVRSGAATDPSHRVARRDHASSRGRVDPGESPTTNPHQHGYILKIVRCGLWEESCPARDARRETDLEQALRGLAHAMTCAMWRGPRALARSSNSCA